MVRKSRKNSENLSKIKIYWTTVHVVELKKEKSLPNLLYKIHFSFCSRSLQVSVLTSHMELFIFKRSIQFRYHRNSGEK